MKINMILEPIYSETELVTTRWGRVEKKFLGFKPKVEVSVTLMDGPCNGYIITETGDIIQECVDNLKAKVMQKIDRASVCKWDEPNEYAFYIKDED